MTRAEWPSCACELPDEPQSSEVQLAWPWWQSQGGTRKKTRVGAPCPFPGTRADVPSLPSHLENLQATWSSELYTETPLAVRALQPVVPPSCPLGVSITHPALVSVVAWKHAWFGPSMGTPCARSHPRCPRESFLQRETLWKPARPHRPTTFLSVGREPGQLGEAPAESGLVAPQATRACSGVGL